MKYDNRIKYDIFKCVYYTNVMIGDDRYDLENMYIMTCLFTFQFNYSFS